MTHSVLVIGSINVDYTAVVPVMPSPGETIIGGDLVVAWGGKGANQAVAAARAGAKTALLGCVGSDAAGGEYLGKLAEQGVYTGLIRTVQGCRTGTALIIVQRHSGENMIAACPEANARLSPEDVDRAQGLIAEAEVMVSQLEMPLETALYAARMAKLAGTPFVLNASPVPAEGVPRELLQDTSFLICNETEGRQIADSLGVGSTMDAAALLLSRGMRAVIITQGAEGCTICGPEGSQHVPAFAVQPVDTVGAGDAFAGALATALSERRPLQEAALFANAAGALAATRPGAMPSLPTRERIAEFMRERGESVGWA